MEITFHLEKFDGPLDLLLSLISKNKVSIMDIPIAVILEQYLEYLDKMKSFDMAVSSDFVDMAAQLTLIKSKMLLPKYDDEEEDPRMSLAEALLEYQRAKEAGERLASMGVDGLFTREPEKIALGENRVFCEKIDVSYILKAVQSILERNERAMPPPINKFNGVVGREKVPVSGKIAEIFRLFTQKDSLSLRELVLSSKSRSDIVAVFLAVLELAKDNKIEIYDETDGDCTMRLSFLKTDEPKEGEDGF